MYICVKYTPAHAAGSCLIKRSLLMPPQLKANVPTYVCCTYIYCHLSARRPVCVCAAVTTPTATLVQCCQLSAVRDWHYMILAAAHGRIIVAKSWKMMAVIDEVMRLLHTFCFVRYAS